ncbi:MAG: esterase/lipase family protein, partial [Burkholderiales bacterium]
MNTPSDQSLKVILLHGLRMNRHVMRYLASSLGRQGFACDTWGYPSSRRDLDANANALAQRLRNESTMRIAIVAHSYGGIITLAQLQRQPDPRVHRVVLLGSPIAGSTAGVQVMRHAFGRWFAGASRPVWVNGPHVSIPTGVQVGSIAGTSRIGLGRFFARFDGPNDGVVTVDETRLPGLTDLLVMPVAHSVMLMSPRV